MIFDLGVLRKPRAALALMIHKIFGGGKFSVNKSKSKVKNRQMKYLTLCSGQRKIDCGLYYANAKKRLVPKKSSNMLMLSRAQRMATFTAS